MKKALIAANLAGFASFLLHDIDILQRMGFEVHYVANTSKLNWDDTKRQLESRNVRIYHVDFDTKNPASRDNLKAYKQIACILKNERFDLIHCHTPITGMIVRVAAARYRMKGTKVIYTTHGFTFTSWSSWKKKLVYRSCEDFCSRLCDAVITINQEDFTNAKQMHAPKVYYIHGVGVKTDRFSNTTIDRTAYRESIGVSEDEIMVLSVGELSARKNHQVIIKALSRIESDKRFVYAICGNGINGGTGVQLAQLAEEKNVKLILLGFRSDIPQIMKCSDIGVIPSLREGLGLAGVQSLAAGVPVIGTDVQGIRDYIDNGNTGLLCEPNDIDGFAAAIEKLAFMETGEKARVKKCCIEMAQRFDVSVSWKEMENIYAEVLL